MWELIFDWPALVKVAMDASEFETSGSPGEES